MIVTCERLNSSSTRLGSEGISIKSKMKITWGSLEKELRGRKGRLNNEIFLQSIWNGSLSYSNNKQITLILQFGRLYSNTVSEILQCSFLRHVMQHGEAIISGLILLRKKKKIQDAEMWKETETKGTYVLSISTGIKKIQPLLLLWRLKGGWICFSLLVNNCIHRFIFNDFLWCFTDE